MQQRFRPTFFLFLLLLILLVVCLIGPFREMMFGDDWAYGLTVRHLLTTGQYKLHDWAAASMPAQIYWGALLAKSFGFSFTVLRFSTIILLLVGVIALYCLLREFGIGDCEASLLSLALVCSPAVLFLSFTFQTDVQFLGWMILALWLYCRALRINSYAWMGLASIAACAAIGTRQFGVVFIVGLLATWFFHERHALSKAPFYLVGLALPLLITIWQISSGVNRSTFSQRVRLIEQSEFVRNSADFIPALLWRPTAILQYLAFFLLPLAPVLISILVRHAGNLNWRRGPGVAGPRPIRFWLWAGIAGYVIAGLCYGYFVYLPKYLMPFLAWLLPNTEFLLLGRKAHLLLTLASCGFGIVLGWLLLSRYAERQNWRLLAAGEWCCLFTGLALLGLQLIYVQFWDVYLIQLLPFAIIATGQMSQIWPRWNRVSVALLGLLMLCFSALWTRGVLARAEAGWRSANIAHASGCAPQDIGGNMTWSCYYGAFDEWIAQLGGMNAVNNFSRAHPMHNAFFQFLEQRYQKAKYRIISLPKKPDEGCTTVERLTFRDRWLRSRDVSLVECDYR